MKEVCGIFFCTETDAQGWMTVYPTIWFLLPIFIYMAWMVYACWRKIKDDQ